jgi:predicted nucleotidyltransferase
MCPADDDLPARLAAALSSMPEVELAYLFGSHAGGRATAESDIDIAVGVEAGAAADARGTLARLFDRLGQVAPSHRLDVVLLHRAPSLLRHRVLTTGRLLFARSPEARFRFVTRTIRDYQDMQVRREFFYRARVKRLKEGGFDGGPGDLLAQARRVARLLGESPGVSSDG